jgi:hypothetical protein
MLKIPHRTTSGLLTRHLVLAMLFIPHRTTSELLTRHPCPVSWRCSKSLQCSDQRSQIQGTIGSYRDLWYIGRPICNSILKKNMIN